MSTEKLKLTPTQELILDVLAARFRTGEILWTFGSRSRKAAEGLRDLGLVALMHGVVERTYRASLTKAGQDLVIAAEYTSPLDRAREKAYDEGWRHGLAFTAGREDYIHNPYRSAS